MNATEWAVECGYIAMLTNAIVGKTNTGNAEFERKFGNDPECFKRYCLMQQKSALREGRPESATYIQHCLDDLGAPNHEPA